MKTRTVEDIVTFALSMGMQIRFEMNDKGVNIQLFELGKGYYPWHSVTASGPTLDAALEDCADISTDTIYKVKFANAEISARSLQLNSIYSNATEGARD